MYQITKHYMKGLLLILICITMLLISSGCSSTVSREVYIDPYQVDWVAVKMGLLGPSTSKALFAQRDFNKILKIVTLINNSTTPRTSTGSEIEAINHVGPSCVVIKQNNGITFRVYPAYKVSRTLNTYTAAPRDNQFVILKEKDKKQFFYTLNSTEVVAKLVRARGIQDLPPIDRVTATPAEVKIGDQVVLKGDGSTEPQVKIYLRDNRGTQKFLVGTPKPIFGEWTWNWVVQKKFRTLDGKPAVLNERDYWFEVEDGSCSSGVGTILLDP